MPVREFLILLALLGAGCHESPVAPSAHAVPPLRIDAPFLSAHFTFVYSTLDSSTMNATADRVERAYGRITQDLGVHELPRVNVHLYAEHSTLAAALAPVIGTIPTWASGVAIRDSLWRAAAGLPLST